MTTLPLFRAHSSRHAKPRAARRPSRLRSWLGAELSALRLWAQTTDCLTPQDPARLIVAASAGRTPDRAETGTAAGDAPGSADPGAVPPYSARHEGMPRRDRRPGRPPWQTAGQPVYGQACVRTVDDARRQFALALGPDGCEEA